MNPESAILMETATPLLSVSFAIKVTQIELQVIVCACCVSGANRNVRSTAMVLRLVFITVDFIGLYKCIIDVNDAKGTLIGNNGKLFTLLSSVMYGRVSGFGFEPLRKVGTVRKTQ